MKYAYSISANFLIRALASRVLRHHLETQTLITNFRTCNVVRNFLKNVNLKQIFEFFAFNIISHDFV